MTSIETTGWWVPTETNRTSTDTIGFEKHPRFSERLYSYYRGLVLRA